MKQILKKIYYLLFPKKDILTELKERGLVVGKNFHMLHDVEIDTTHCWHITIGNNVTLAPRVHILAHDASMKKFIGYARIGKVDIGDNVFIGASTIILPGVRIGNNVIIGAGSVISKDIQSNSVVVGNPAKKISTFDEYINKKNEELNKLPKFGEEYTLRQNVTESMKNQMNEKMIDRIGYII